MGAMAWEAARQFSNVLHVVHVRTHTHRAAGKDLRRYNELCKLVTNKCALGCTHQSRRRVRRPAVCAHMPPLGHVNSRSV